MGRVGLVLAAIVVTNILTLHWAPLYADLIPSAPESVPASTGDTGREAVQGQLAGMGFSGEDLASRMSALSPEDMAVLGQNPEQIQVAGLMPAVVAIGIAIAVGLVLILLIESDNQAETPEPIAPTQ